MHFEIKQPQFTLPILGGIQLNRSVAIGWVLVAIICIFCIIVNRKIKKFSEKPKGFQNIIELAVGWVSNYAETRVGKYAVYVGPYCLVIMLYLALNAVLELLGIEAPITDLSQTLAMGLFTFFWINYIGLKANGVRGRLRQYTKPVFFMAPIKLLTDIAVPISMGCRLFGNALAGSIVMMLLYSVVFLRIGVPAALSAYFNIIHIAIQGYIFITLTLSFIGETLEEEHE